MARIRLAALSLSILSILVLYTPSYAAPTDRIGAITSGPTVRFASGVPLQARPEFDQGAVDPAMKMGYLTLLTKPTAAQQKAINKLLADQQNPHSASYHKWLTPEQYADRFGLSQSDMNKLAGWLQAQGFTIVRTARARNWVAFSGTAAQVEAAFQTPIHNFKTGGEIHFSNTSPAVIPSALSGIVTGVRGLSNFRPQSQARRAVPAYSFSGGNYQFISPGDITTIYDVATLYGSGIDGTGQKLAVMGETGIYQSDLTNFRQNFGLSAISCTTSNDIITACNTSHFKYVLVNGTATQIYGDLPEADIDLEWSGATAPGAQVIYVTSNANNGTTWDSWYYAVDNNVAPVITMSYTSPCELAEDPFGTGEFSIASDEAELAQANIQGITFMNSSGDTGVAECDYQASLAEFGYAAAYPASSQYVTGVGGTLIPYTEYGSTYWTTSNGTGGGSAKSYIPEEAWNDSLEFAIFCEANQSTGFCTGNGVGSGPLLTDWDIMQENVIGIAAGGGGISNCSGEDANGVCNAGFGQPTWQAGLDLNSINPNGLGQTTSPARFSPDVSLLASANWPGYIVCTQITPGSGSTCDSPTTGIQDMLTQCIVNQNFNYCSIYGGTSVSAPIFAGMVTLLNQYVVTNGIQANPGLGNVNPTLYALAADNATNGAFNPVTTANTGSYSIGAFCDPGQPVSGITGDPWPAALQCPSSGTNLIGFNTFDFDATTKYNLAVGLGSVNLSHLAAAWSVSGLSSTTTSVASSLNPSNLDDSVTFTATVTTSGTNVPTGTVTFKDGTTTLGTGTLGCVCDGIINSATTTFTTSSLAAGTHAITALYNGDSNNSTSSGSLDPPQIVDEQDFQFSGTVSDPAAADPGQTTTTSMTIQAVGSSTFLDTVTYSCSGLPTGATCSFNPTSGTIVSGTASPQTVQITVNTSGPFQGAAGGGVRSRRRRAQNQQPRLWLPLTLPLAGIFFVGLAGRGMRRRYQVAGLCLMVVFAGFLIACGGGGSSPAPVAVSVSPGSVNTLWPNLSGAPLQAQQFTANVTGTSNSAVTWAISSGGTDDSISSSGLYTAPTSTPPGAVTITATSQADTSKHGNATVTIKTPTPSGPSTVTVTVKEGSGAQAITHSTPFTLTVN